MRQFDKSSADWPEVACNVTKTDLECCCCNWGFPPCWIYHTSRRRLLETKIQSARLELSGTVGESFLPFDSEGPRRKLLDESCQPGYRAEFDVFLTVDGKDYSTVATRWASWAWDEFDSAKDYQKQFIPGQQYTCRYKPDDPDVVVMNSGVRHIYSMDTSHDESAPH
mmetsp:Transcript_15694/g.34110  ORF Transcript_15694/g.34110 Transcript_15694/m.34110 type:complete len:167 (-) Transcript_15694:156-656(-)